MSEILYSCSSFLFFNRSIGHLETNTEKWKLRKSVKTKQKMTGLQKV
jgi:hypothetical protein